VATNDGEAVVELTIPGKPEYVGVARLAILGVASRMRFSYDEVEDIRLAVGEACTTAIERATGGQTPSQDVRVRCLIDPTRLVVEVTDSAAASSPAEQPPVPESVLEERSLGGVLIRILMDDVQITQEPESRRHVVRMTKYVAGAAR
jgi:serine/threonine-protein kinase RsbW